MHRPPYFFLRLAGLALLGGTLAAAPARAQVPGWQSVATATNSPFSGINVPSTANVVASAPISGGDLILVGSFTGNVTFGSTTLNNVVNAGQGTYVARFRPATNSFVWARQVDSGTSSISNNQPTAVAVAGSSIYVAGSFNQGPASFGNQPYTTGSMGGYVAKLTDTGSSADWVWVQPIRSSTNVAPVTALAVSGTSVYVAGTFTSNLRFGNLLLSNNQVSSSDLFVGRLTDAGSSASYDWVAQAMGNNGISAQSLAVEGNHVYLAGGLTNGGLFGLAGIPTGNRMANPYLARLTDNGTGGVFDWASHIGSVSGTSYGNYVSGLLWHNGALYVAGTYTATLTLGPGLAFSSTLGSSDVFVAKLTDTGTGPRAVWALSGGGPGIDIGTCLATDGTSLYLGGTFRSASAGFGSRTLLNSSAAGTTDVFLSRIEEVGASASFAWTLGAGGTGNETAGAVVPLAGFTYLLGSVEAPATFGTVPVLAGASTQPRAFVATATPTLTATTAAAGAQVQLFPNPATGRVRLELPAAQPARIAVHNALGQLVHQQRSTGPAQLDLGHLARGVYVVQVHLPAGTVARRLVLE